MREVVCTGLTGRVLEIGFGSGRNVRWYPPEVTSVTAIEPSDLGWQISERRRARGTVPIERAGLDGQRLVESAGWHVVDREESYLPGPAVARPWTYVYRLVAR